ncbi:MAG: tetratricopeptide repeat protein, partial [Lysobacterales bacterium]
LDRRRLERDALVGVLEGSTADVTGSALQAAAALPSPSSCSDPRALLDDVAPPSDALAESVAAVRSQLADAKSTLDVAADADAALTLAQAAVERADAIGYAPLAAEARLRLGATTVAKGDLPAGQALLEQAYFAAIAADHELVAMQAAAALLNAIGVRAARPADALAWWDHGEALLRKRGPSPRESYQLRSAYANVLAEQGKFAESLAAATQSVVDADAGFGPEHPNAASARQIVALAHFGLGQYAEAIAIDEDVVARLERMYGEEHPAVATAMASTALALSKLGRHADALEQHQRALAIFERTIGGATREAGFTLANIGNIHRRLGDHEAALTSTQRAQDALLRALGPDHPRTVMIGGSIGHILLGLGRLDEARTVLQATIDALTRIDPKSVELPNNHDRLGLVELAAGDCARSVEHHRRAFELASALGLPAFTLAHQQLNLGVALICLRRPADAIVELERARAAWVADDPKVRAKSIDDADRALASAHFDAGRADVALSTIEAVLDRCAVPACTDELRADALVLAAEARLALGRVTEARQAADEALTIRERVGGDAWARGDACWVAAQARHADGVRGAELDALVDRARAALREAGPRGEAKLATWPAWARR